MLTEDYVPRIPTVTKDGKLIQTKRFFNRGFLQLKDDDTLEDVITQKTIMKNIRENASFDLFSADIEGKLSKDNASSSSMNAAVVDACRLAQGVNLSCHHQQAHQN